MLLKQSDFFFFLHFVIWCSWCCESWVWHPSPAPKALGIKRCCQGRQMNAFFCNFVGDDLEIVKQMSFWRIGDWTWQTFCYMPIIDSISQLIDGVSIVFGDFGRLCSCQSVIALGGQFSWNWSKVAVNRDLLNVERAVWFPVFWTCHRPHHVSGVRGPGNGSLFFRWIAHAIYSGSCLIPLRRSPSATAMNKIEGIQMVIIIMYVPCQPVHSNCAISMATKN